MPRKKAFDIDGLSESQKRDFNMLSEDIAINKRGIQGDVLIEPKPNLIKRKGSKLIEGTNNCDITLGTDQPGEIGSGLKGTGIGAIDIVAGRMSKDIQTQIENVRGNSSIPLYTDNNLSLDASRITVSQLTNIDKNFGFADGQIGQANERAAIVLKSDALRFAARDAGVKILTGVDRENSLGGRVASVPRIEMIAGNNDRNLQAATKAEKNEVVVKDVLDRLDELNSALDTFITAQTEFNTKVSAHNHMDITLQAIGVASGGGPGAINGGKNLPSTELLSAGTKVFSTEMISKFDNIINKLKAAVVRLNSTEVYGDKRTASKSIFTS